MKEPPKIPLIQEGGVPERRGGRKKERRYKKGTNEIITTKQGRCMQRPQKPKKINEGTNQHTNPTSDADATDACSLHRRDRGGG